MALVALASVKGAPFVTTTALAIDAVWPADRPVVLAELDPAGGDIAARRGLAAEPGLISLAAAVRGDRTATAEALLDHCQELPGGLRLIAGPAAPAEMRSAAEVVGEALPALAAGAGVDVIVDCGRLEGCALLTVGGEARSARAVSTPAWRIIGRADLVVVVTRAELADLTHVLAWLPTLRSLNTSLSLLLVGQLTWRASEIAEEFEVDIVGHVPHDPVGAAVVYGHPRRASVTRLPLLRAATEIVDRLVERLPIPEQPTPVAVEAGDLRRAAVMNEPAP